MCLLPLIPTLISTLATLRGFYFSYLNRTSRDPVLRTVNSHLTRPFFFLAPLSFVVLNLFPPLYSASSPILPCLTPSPFDHPTFYSPQPFSLASFSLYPSCFSFFPSLKSTLFKKILAIKEDSKVVSSLRILKKLN